METTLNNSGHILLVVLSAFLPLFVAADVSQFAFTSQAQTVLPGAVSEAITLQAQDSTGQSSNIPQTACINLSSSSLEGQFSSSATNWNPVTTLTMNKNTANRNFYYKDSASGTHSITAKITLKPETESSSCANWPVEEWNKEWSPTQNIIIGTTGSGGNGSEQNQSTTNTTQSTNTAQSSTNSTSSYVAPPEQQIFADAGVDRSVIVGADSIFNGRAYNKKKESVSDHIRFLWNFGDGSTAEGQSVLHRFVYPGRYAVVLNVTDELETASERIIVTAESANLSFSFLSDGGVSIENLGEDDIDLSNWIVRFGSAQFMLPKNSLILAGESFKISAQTLGFQSGSAAELAYPNGSRAYIADKDSSAGKPETTKPIASVESKDVPNTEPTVKNAQLISKKTEVSADISQLPPQESDLSDEGTEESGNVSSQLAAAAEANDSYLWWLGAFGIALAGGGAVYASRRASRKEWNIIEEK